MVRRQDERVYISVPLRNVGRGLAVIDGSGVEIEGFGIGSLDDRTFSATTFQSARRHASTLP